ncbi:MAG: hypothetical protein M1816_006066 [Peltula sp. TS41687]|nr:MAG: hypothetical protein M1816_006066 [Peltula sp. TS41687]
MTNQELFPKVIPPLSVVIKGCEYECAGDGLLRNKQSFQSDLTDYLPLLEPKRTKAGAIAARQPQPIKKNKDWWQAQCAFRGLSQSGNLSQLQDRLRGADSKRMSTDHLEAEVKLNRDFRQQNAAVRDSKWNKLATDEAKAEADPVRFLRETFVPGERKTTAVVVKTHHRLELHQAATSLNLQSQATEAPLNPNGSRPSVDRWIVIGRDYSAVNKKIADIDREAKATVEKRKMEKEKQISAEHKEVTKKAKAKAAVKTAVKAAAKATAKTTAKTTAKSSVGWDVTGTWAISCPEIEENWGNGNEECTLTIHEAIDGPAKQIWAEFDFIAVTGVLRLVRPTSQQASKPAKGSKKRKREESEEPGPNYGRAGAGGGGRVSYLLDRDDGPSRSHSTWEYRWRGEETGEGEIQLYSDEEPYSIEFFGPRGTELRGEFGGGFMKRCKITGRKISGGDGSANYLSVEDEWSQRSEDAYEHARVARW